MIQVLVWKLEWERKNTFSIITRETLAAQAMFLLASNVMKNLERENFLPCCQVYTKHGCLFNANSPRLYGSITDTILGAISRKSWKLSGAESRFVFVMFVCKVKVSRILRYSDTMKLSVNKEKVTGLWARNYATILQVLILKFAFVPGKFPGLLKNSSPPPWSPALPYGSPNSPDKIDF